METMLHQENVFLNVLIIEDSAEDVELIVLELRRAGYSPRWRRVDSASQLSSALNDGTWHVILCDYTMSNFTAGEALRIVQAKGVKAVVYAGQGATEKSAKETKDQEEISRNAREFEDDVKKASLQSEKSLAHHHRFAYAVTLFQISIALSAVAALSRQKLVWVIGLAISVVALLFFLSGFWLFA